LLIAHNCGYDFRFIFNRLIIIDYVAKGKKLMFVNAKYSRKDGKKINIKIRDSLNMLNMPLRNFKKSFDKDYKTNCKNEDYEIKEVMPYKLYTQDNIKKVYVPIVEALIHFDNKEDKERFLKNLEKWKIKIDDKFNIIEYSKEYCLIDCEILKFGYLTFRKWMLEITELDINKFVSLPAIAQQYLINRDCYDGIYYLQGIPQIFISRCVVGGRTMLRDNTPQKITNTKISDYDGVSLYPSAMKFINGFLKGLPKVLKECIGETYDKIPNYLADKDGYFLKIIIKDVGIKRHFPLGSIISGNGTRNFTNDLVGHIQYVDNYTLEDLIEFQKIKYEIIQGYYFNEGLNNKINTVIEELFNERLKKKKEGNPIQIVFKELMNSAYGKTILKPIEHETKIFNDTKTYNSFINRNYEFVSEIVNLSGENNDKNCKRYVKVIKNLLVHKNIPQVGVQVLSRSKRIMNEVICSAEDNNIDIYYQDTDSIHIKEEDINKLTEIYKNKYGRELEGKNLGQFHPDFDFEGCKDIHAIDCLFVAKKIYIDRLKGTDIKTGETKYTYHKRMKGISEAGLEYSAIKNNCSIWDLYEKLYNGETISMDLGAGGKKPIFKLNKDFTIETLKEMIRNIKTC
jgi:hypothetical protein